MTQDGPSPDVMSKGLVVAGFIVVSALLGGLSLWMFVRYYKTRTSKRRKDDHGAAFLHIRGVTRAGGMASTPKCRSAP